MERVCHCLGLSINPAEFAPPARWASLANTVCLFNDPTLYTLHPHTPRLPWLTPLGPYPAAALLRSARAVMFLKPKFWTVVMSEWRLHNILLHF